MKINFKKTLSLVLAMLMVIAVVPFSGMATVCEHEYAYSVSPVVGKHYKTCVKCYDNALVDCSTAEEICGQKRVCDFCERAYGDYVAHVFNQETVDSRFLKTAGDCQTKAVYYVSCKCGALPENLATAVTFEGTTGDHAWNSGTSNNDATCTQDGTKNVTCNKCGATATIKDEGSVKGHNFTLEIADADHLYTEGTCERKARYFKTCSVCNFNAKDLGEDANRPTFETDYAPHKFIVPATPIEGTGKTPATCTSAATFYKTCEVCAISAKGIDENAFYADGPLAEHNFINNAQDKYRISQATCTERAIYAKSCSFCGVGAVVNSRGEDITTPGFNPTDITLEVYVEGEYVPAGKEANAFRWGAPLNHGKTSISKEAKEPTCTVDGRTEEVKCDYCGVILTESQKVPMLGHQLAEKPSQEYKAPTCKQYGQVGKIDCVRCNTSFGINEKGELLSLENIFSFKLEPLGHEDNDHDMVCDRGECGALLEESDLCTCIACNGQGFMYFIGWILKWVWSIMGTNQYCECGMAHY